MRRSVTLLVWLLLLLVSLPIVAAESVRVGICMNLAKAGLLTLDSSVREIAFELHLTAGVVETF